jgi:hypothetical protein
MSNQTLICRSMQSFFDLCDNKLVTLCNIHCTFLIIESDFLWMEIELRSKGGKTLTSSKSANHNKYVP